MKQRFRTYLSGISIILCLGGFSLVACTDDNDLNAGSSNKGAVVGFEVSNEQQDALERKEMAAKTRAIVVQELFTPGLKQEDLVGRVLDVTGAMASEASIVETTVEGINPVMPTSTTRATIKAAIDADFTSLGYRGTTESGISTTPNYFYKERTGRTGQLYATIPWSWQERYARFYGIYPEVNTTNSNIVLSAENYSGTPYIDYTVPTDVLQQQDLMTACSGVVTYATRNTAPESLLRFRHALTAVNFAVGANLSWNKIIDRIEIRNAMGKGRYTMATDANGTGAGWSQQSVPTTFTLSGLSVSTKAAANTVIAGASTDNYTFYMIPQELTNRNVKLYIHFTDGSTATATLTGSWLAGTTKTYKLSERGSDWTYTIVATDPNSLGFKESQTNTYSIASYRTADNGGQTPVSWRVVGYEESSDNGATWGTMSATKPTWLSSLTLSNGTGGTSAVTGTATLTTNYINVVDETRRLLRAKAAVGTADNPYDLSTKGGTTTMNTANCYVVSGAGHYKIPLVYGNGIKNGAANTQSYAPTAKAAPSGRTFLTPFKDHADANITSPYIGAKYTATQAQVMWSEINNLVTNVRVVGSGQDTYLQFEVPSTLDAGNALVAVKNAAGTVLWSWHIWVTPERSIATTPLTSRLPNNATRVYHIPEIPLGFVFTSGEMSTYTKARKVRVTVEQDIANNGVKQRAQFVITHLPGASGGGKGTLYQFGRKDPFPTKALAQGSMGTEALGGTGRRSLGNAIQKPATKFSTDNTAADFYNASYVNLWDADNVELISANYVTSTATVLKSVYDPSPVGFVMPWNDAFTGLTRTPQSVPGPTDGNILGGWTGGYLYYNHWSNSTGTVYFPAYGRYSNGGALLSPEEGFYWTAAIIDGNDSKGAMAFWLKQTNVTSPNYLWNRTSAFGVCPVAE